jgi:hypothetical protein
MAFDFPSSPTVGQQFTPVAGVTYTYNGVGWTLVSGGGADPGLTPSAGRLTFLSATALKFAPFNGNKIKINGTIYAIPNAGIAGLANTSVFVNGTGGQNLAANTTYYLYAFINSGTVTGDFRTDGNGHITDTTSGNEGVEVRCSSGMTPDPTRTLIGIIRTNASSQFVNSATQRFVRSWFNRVSSVMNKVFTGQRITTSNVSTELNAEIRCEFVLFVGEPVSASIDGSFYNGTASGRNIYASIAFDGVTNEGYVATSGLDNAALAMTIQKSGLAEGYHYATHVGWSATSGDQATFGTGGSPLFNALWVKI